MAIISIKMIDGSRYETTQTITATNSGNWIMIQCDGKIVKLNPKYIVSITEVGGEE